MAFNCFLITFENNSYCSLLMRVIFFLSAFEFATASVKCTFVMVMIGFKIKGEDISEDMVDSIKI